MIFAHLADGFEEIEALTIVDLLRRAGLETKTVSIMGRLNVTGAHGVTVAADTLFEDADSGGLYGDCKVIVLPGGMPGAENLAAHEGLRKHILDFQGQGKTLAAICAAPLVFGRLGILSGKKAACYPGFEGELKGAEVKTDAVVTDGNVITSRGPATAIPFALAIVETLKGKDAADKISADILAR